MSVNSLGYIVPSSATGWMITTKYVSSAEFKGAYANPVQIVAAPGAGKRIVLLLGIVELSYNTTQYQNGGTIGLQFGNTPHAAGTPAAGQIANTTVNGLTASASMGLASGVFLLSSTPQAATIDQGIYLTNDTAAFTDGDSTFKVLVYHTTE